MRLKRFAVLFPLCLCLTVLSACGSSRHELSGTYSATTFNVTQSYTFGNKAVTVQFFIMGFEVGRFEGTYTLNEEETQITLTFDSNQFPSNPSFPSEFTTSGGTFTFQRGDGYILIGPMRYSLEERET